MPNQDRPVLAGTTGGYREFRPTAALDARAGQRKVRRILVTGLPPSEVEMPPNLDLLLEKPYSVQDIIAAIEGRLETAAPPK